MSTSAVSLIVVSLNRPDALCRCLAAIEQLDYSEFEVIVVADAAGQSASEAAGFSDRIKSVTFDTPNISAARNVGLSRASGGIVAFIDDDAVPEPTWLSFLVDPFRNEIVAAAGGFVVGRNGISLQYGARSVDRFGTHSPLIMKGNEAQVFDPPDGAAIKTEGTNCAFRRDALLAMGGFDPAFAFFMDETDLNLRLAKAGARTAIAPLAQVHHGFAASQRRRSDRVPLSLHDIGASQMVLLRKHAVGVRIDPVLDRLRAEQKARMVRHLVSGACEPRDVRRLLNSLEAGLIEGKIRPIRPLRPIPATAEAFVRFRPRTPFKGDNYRAGRIWSSSRLRRETRKQVETGVRMTLFLFSPTALYHRVRFTRGGYWEQTGGVFGRSDRDGRMFQPVSFPKRVSREIRRIGTVRGLHFG